MNYRKHGKERRVGSLEYITRCNKCNCMVDRQSAFEHYVGRTDPDETILRITIYVPEADEHFTHDENIGHICKDCFMRDVMPRIKKLQQSKNVTVSIKNAPK